MRYALILLLLVGCRSLPVPVLITETSDGEKMTMQEIEKTGDIGDIPAGVKREDVVSMMSFSHAGGKLAKVGTIKSKWNPFAKPHAYFNCIDCHVQTSKQLGAKAERPEDPWYRWPLILLILSAIGAVFWFWNQIRAFLGPLSGALGLITRLWRKK